MRGGGGITHHPGLYLCIRQYLAQLAADVGGNEGQLGGLLDVPLPNPGAVDVALAPPLDQVLPSRGPTLPAAARSTRGCLPQSEESVVIFQTQSVVAIFHVQPSPKRIPPSPPHPPSFPHPSPLSF